MVDLVRELVDGIVAAEVKRRVTHRPTSAVAQPPPAVVPLLPPRRTRVLDQRNRVFTGKDERVFLAEGGAGTLNEATLVSPTNDYFVTLTLDDIALYRGISWTDAANSNPHNAHLSARQVDEGFAFNVSDLKFLHRVEMRLRVPAVYAFPVVTASFDLDPDAVLTPASDVGTPAGSPSSVVTIGQGPLQL